MDPVQKLLVLKTVLDHWVTPSVDIKKTQFYTRLDAITQNRHAVYKYVRNYGCWEVGKDSQWYHGTLGAWIPCEWCHGANTMKVVEENLLLCMMCTRCGWTRYNMFLD